MNDKKPFFYTLVFNFIICAGRFIFVTAIFIALRWDIFKAIHSAFPLLWSEMIGHLLALAGMQAYWETVKEFTNGKDSE